MNSELEVLLDVVARLDGAGIGYMLTGSVAMSVYAEPRMTRDIDVVVELDSVAAGTVVRLFSPDYYVDDKARCRRSPPEVHGCVTRPLNSSSSSRRGISA